MPERIGKVYSVHPVPTEEDVLIIDVAQSQGSQGSFVEFVSKICTYTCACIVHTCDLQYYPTDMQSKQHKDCERL